MTFKVIAFLAGLRHTRISITGSSFEVAVTQAKPGLAAVHERG